MSADLQPIAESLVARFAQTAGISAPNFSVGSKGGLDFLSIFVGSENAVFSSAISRVNDQLEGDHPLKDRIVLEVTKPKAWLSTPEVELLQKTISDHLTIGKDTLASDFFRKFIPFVGAEEKKIFSRSNSVIFGRRGAGKSSLLLYAANQAQHAGKPFVWLNMQQYAHRDDPHVLTHVIWDFFDALHQNGCMDAQSVERAFARLRALDAIPDVETLDRLRREIPAFIREVRPIIAQHDSVFVLMDDLHVVEPSLQPKLLSTLYSIARGNGVYLKVTAIENMTHIYDHGSHEGLETPGDAQVTRLDYNLVNPKASFDHISNIINAYMKYLGIPSVLSVINRSALVRLIWVSAGVPRDALYMFNNAINKARNAKRTKLALTDINLAASDLFIEKKKYITVDSGADESLVANAIESIKEFCIKELKSNAFLVKVDADHPNYKIIRKVSDLRFIHILHTGITPKRAGEKYEAYILDYALYTGFRKSRGMNEFYTGLEAPPAKQFRQLKEYKYASADFNRSDN